MTLLWSGCFAVGPPANTTWERPWHNFFHGWNLRVPPWCAFQTWYFGFTCFWHSIGKLLFICVFAILPAGDGNRGEGDRQVGQQWFGMTDSLFIPLEKFEPLENVQRWWDHLESKFARSFTSPCAERSCQPACRWMVKKNYGNCFNPRIVSGGKTQASAPSRALNGIYSSNVQGPQGFCSNCEWAPYNCMTPYINLRNDSSKAKTIDK